MLIGIDVRPLQLEAYKTRGIGNHLRGWIGAAQQSDSSHQFLLLHDPKLAAPNLSVSAPNWELCPLELPFSPDPVPEYTPHGFPDAELVYDSMVEAFAVEHNLDLFHSTYTLMWETFVARRINTCRTVVTFYDLIPLIYRGIYLDPLGERARRSFVRRVGAAVYAQRVQTISQHSKNDLVRVTGMSPEKIDVIYSGVDEIFEPIDDQARIASVLSALDIQSPYIFAVLGFHHTKNLQRALAAYAALPDDLRTQYQFVLRCHFSAQGREQFRAWLNECAITDRVKVLDDLSPSQLVALYNGATVLIHPTLYEGFGLPVAEAMRCGTPVVTSRASSLPEVAGDAAELVNPEDPRDIARGITNVLRNPDSHAEMIEKGLRHVAQFTWQYVAEKVLASYDVALDAPLYNLNRTFHAVPTARRLRLAYWSPLNPKHSGVCDYSEPMIVALGQHADVDVYVDGYQPTNAALADTFPMFDGQAYPAVARRRHYDINLYQIGNNALHHYIYPRIFAEPGIVTLHDIVLYHLVHYVFMKDGRLGAFWDEIAYCEGEDKSRQAKVNYLSGRIDDYSLPLNKRIVQASRGIITHSRFAADSIAKYDGCPPVRVSPFGSTLFEDDGGKFARYVRHQMGIPEGLFLIGVFGIIHHVKRVNVVLRAFEKLQQLQPNTALFIMGPIDVSASSYMQSLQMDPARARERNIYLFPMYVPSDLMHTAIEMVDIAVNMRYPTAGETSGSLHMLLGQGKPAIVSDVGSYREYPDACCPKVPLNEDEEDILLRYMHKLATDRAALTTARQAAYAYSRANTWDRCAERYLAFIEQLL